jgi:uncharacterized membrane protein
MVKAEKIICNRGAAAVEAAIILPLLLLITFAVIEYGWLFLKSQQITNAARHGARIAILNSAAQDYVESEIERLMAKAGMAQSKCGYWVTYPLGDVESVAVGQPLTVKVEVLSANVDIVNYSLLPRPTNIRASVTMSKEGP